MIPYCIAFETGKKDERTGMGMGMDKQNSRLTGYNTTGKGRYLVRFAHMGNVQHRNPG